MKSIVNWLKGFVTLFFRILIVIVICLVAIAIGIILKVEFWPIFVSILAGTGLFFAIYKSFGEYKKSR